MVGLVSPRKRCTYSAKNARVSVQSHGADLSDKGKRPNWRRFYYSPIENGKVVVPVNARFDDRTTTALQTQSWCLRGITRMECHRMRSIPTLNIRRLAAKDQLAYYSNYAERFDIAAPGGAQTGAATLRPTSRRHFSKANDPGRTLRRVF